MITEDYLIVDTECWQPTGEPDPNTAELRYVGMKSSKGNVRIYHISQAKEIQDGLDRYNIIVGHNIKEYDKIVLERYGFSLKWPKVLVDTYHITKSRAKSMMYIDFNKGDLSLSKLCEFFKLPYKKLDFNYKLLEQSELKNHELKELQDYLTGDLNCTEELFKYLYEFFIGFKDLVSDKDKDRLSWLTSSAGAVTYKVICNQAGIKEEYEDIEESDEPQYAGGYVTEPTEEFIEGDIYCYDQTSLYPHMFIGGNLYSPVTEGGWNGSGVYPNMFANDIDGIVGRYNTVQGPIEKTIQSLFEKRKTFPKSDKRNLAYKIVINTAYGISGCSKFKNLFNLTTAADCTRMARRTIKHVRTMLEFNGYKLLYTDTDSVYILDPLHDKDRLDAVCKFISATQRRSMNIKVDSHNLAFESKIKRMYFFRDDKGEFIKKHYCFVTDKDEPIIKGIQAKKGTASPLAKLIVEEVVKPMMIRGEPLVHPFDFWFDIAKQYAMKNPDLLTKRFRVWPLSTYKIAEGKDEATAIHAQISKRYGEGEHYLIINSRLGVGKGNHYATLNELKEKYGPAWIETVKLNEYLGDLREFIEWKDRRRIKK